MIPANMKTVVDRIANNALELVDEALNISNINNISRARFWVNQMEESILKDELQQKLNEILSVDGMELERQTVSSNIDVYIKSENMLSLSLDTNNVMFDNFSGVEDVEMLNAVNLTVNSSLPYKINACLMSEIQNANKSEKIDSDMLKIKANSENDYKDFTNTLIPVILLDDQNSGNNISHKIDLKLSSNQAHKADVYKTVIKFEAEQK